MTGHLQGWESSPFSSGGITHEVFRRGTGPAVIVVHEVPGITPKVLRFAEEVVESGFTVAMPSLVGTPGREVSAGYAVASLARVCISREFTTMATGRTSPVVAWLRALAAALHAESGGPGVGAVGMCFSGGFVLGMMVDPVVVAPVASQPSLPLPVGKKRAADLGLSSDDAGAVARRASQGCAVMGLRFASDPLVGERFATLRALVGDAFVAVELPSQGKRDHSVLTEQRDDPSVEKVLAFLRERLA